MNPNPDTRRRSPRPLVFLLSLVVVVLGGVYVLNAAVDTEVGGPPQPLRGEPGDG